MMKKCKCGGYFKEEKIEYVIKSRDTNTPETIIENLTIYRCNVCSLERQPESSKRHIEAYREKMKRNIQTRTYKSEPIIPERKPFLSILKNILG